MDPFSNTNGLLEEHDFLALFHDPTEAAIKSNLCVPYDNIKIEGTKRSTVVSDQRLSERHRVPDML